MKIKNRIVSLFAVIALLLATVGTTSAFPTAPARYQCTEYFKIGRLFITGPTWTSQGNDSVAIPTSAWYITCVKI